MKTKYDIGETIYIPARITDIDISEKDGLSYRVVIKGHEDSLFAPRYREEEFDVFAVRKDET